MKKLLFILFAVLTVATLVPAPDLSSRFAQEFQNSGHLLLGAVLAAIIIAGNPRPGWFRHHRHAWFFAIAVLVLGSLELAQFPIARDASASDLALGMLAAASVMVAHLGMIQSRRRHRNLLFAGSFLLMMAGLAPLLLCSFAYLKRDMRFPILSDLSSISGRTFLELRHTRLNAIADAGDDQLVATMCLAPQRWAGVAVDEVYPDWRGYDYLLVEIGIPGSQPASLTLRVNDAPHDLNYDDRFNRELELTGGLNRIAIPLELIRDAPSGRTMQMDKIARIALFSPLPASRSCFDLGNFSLIGGRPDADFTILD